MRQWINASNILNEAGLINTNRSLSVSWPCNDGSTHVHEIKDAQSSVVMIWDEVPGLDKWLTTVFLNWLKPRARELEASYPILQYIDEVIGGNAFYLEHAKRPKQELFGDGKDLKDTRFDEYILKQLPEWAQDGEVLFPWGAETYYSIIEDSDNAVFKFSEILDYLQSVVENGGRIERMSVPDVIAQSAAWHAKRGKVYSEDVPGEDIKDILDFHDGYKIVQLLTPAALDRESALCDHCVGKGGYDEHLIKGGVRIFSLRDDKNHPYATIEVRQKRVKQVKGHDNGPVAEDVRQHIMKFILAAGLYLDQDHKHLGLERLPGFD